MTWIGSVLQGSFGQYAFGGSEAGCCGVWVLSCRSSFFFFFSFPFLLLFSSHHPISFSCCKRPFLLFSSLVLSFVVLAAGAVSELELGEARSQLSVTSPSLLRSPLLVSLVLYRQDRGKDLCCTIIEYPP